MRLHKSFQILIVLGLTALHLNCASDSADKEVIASIEGRSWTVEEVQEKLDRLAELPGQKIKTAKEKRQFIQELVRKEILFREAINSGFLENSEPMREELAREFLISKVGHQEFEPSEKQIRDFYEEKKSELDQVRVAHILIPADKDFEDPIQSAREKAESLLKKLKSGADFAELARKFSSDKATASQGGDLGFKKRGSLVEPFADAAFALEQQGDLSPIVQSRFGFHVIKLLQARHGLSYWRPYIAKKLVEDRKIEAAEKLFDRLDQKFDLRVYEKRLDQIGSDKNTSLGEES